MRDKKAEILKKFQCHKTGNCCRVEGVVYANADEINRMADILRIDVITFMQKYVKKRDGWLLVADHAFRPDCFLDSENRCKVYDARPQKCRTYPDWPEIWQSDESVYRETLLCKGLRQAVEVVSSASK